MSSYDETSPGDIDADPRPRDLHAERATIGAMLLSRVAREQIIPLLGDGAPFYLPRNQTIYCTIARMHDDPNATVDPLTVADALRRAGELVLAGGDPYLYACVDAVPTAANGEYYADIVRTQWQLRRLYEVGAHLTQRARMQDAEPDELAGLALAELQAVLGAAAGGDGELLSVADRWEPFLSELENQDDPRALDSPWADLNEVVQFRPKELTVVGAATSGGKSLLALNLAAHVALRREQPVLVASIEMGGTELLVRLASAEGNIEMDQLMRRRLGDREWTKLGRITPRMLSEAARDFVLDDSPGLTIPKIESRIRWMDAQGRKPAAVVVDYLQIVAPDGPSSGKNRTQEVAGISLGLKRIADKFDLPVVALAQFNRSVVGRRPLVTDFKDSSQIEQDASTILLLHRELDEDGNDTGPNAGKVMLIVAKNRNGQRGREIWLSFQGKYASLRSLTTETPPPWTPTVV